MNNNNNNDNSSAGNVNDSTTTPSPVRPLLIVKLEPGVTAPNVNSIVHNESLMEGNECTTGTAGSSSGNPFVIPSSPSPPPQLSPPRLSNRSSILTVLSNKNEPVDLFNSPTKAGKMHSRDDNNNTNDTNTDNNNDKKTNLDICIKIEADKHQALIVAAGAAATAATSAVTSSTFD